jgi:hypothetical protein
MASNERFRQKEYTCENMKAPAPTTGTYQSKVMTKIKFFEKKIKLQRSDGQGHDIKMKGLARRDTK